MSSFRSIFNVSVLAICVVVATNNLCGAQNAKDKTAIISAIQSEALTDDQFDLLTHFIQPSNAEEKWRETAWIPSIHEGRKLGVAQNKPLFIWAMNGDPLGCV